MYVTEHTNPPGAPRHFGSYGEFVEIDFIQREIMQASFSRFVMEPLLNNFKLLVENTDCAVKQIGLLSSDCAGLPITNLARRKCAA